MARPRPEDLRITPVTRGQARGAAPPMRRPATGGATTARGGTLADVQRIMDNSPPKIREAIAEILDRDGVAAAITFIKNMGSARRASPAARPTQVAGRTRPIGPARTGPARMMKGGMYKGKTHSYVAGGKVTEGKY